jgi:hypothetical protein
MGAGEEGTVVFDWTETSEGIEEEEDGCGEPLLTLLGPTREAGSNRRMLQ